MGNTETHSDAAVATFRGARCEVVVFDSAIEGLMVRGFHEPDDVEIHLGYHMGQSGA